MSLKMSSTGQLTEEQRRKIEENKRKALAKLAQKKGLCERQSTGGSKLNVTNTWTSTQNIPQNTAHVRNIPVSSRTLNNVTASGGSSTFHNGYPVSKNQPKTASDISVSYSKPIIQTKQTGTVNTQTTANVSNKTQCVALSSNNVNISKSFYGTRPKVQTNNYVSKPSTLSKKCVTASSNVLHADSLSSFRSLLNGSVKGSCVLSSRETFTVDVNFHPALIEVFKAMKTKQYDALSKKWSFKLEDYEELMRKLRGLRPEVDISPLPSAVKMIFSAQLSGKYPSHRVPEADLSMVDPVLSQALLPFQRVGVSFGVWRKGRVLIADDMGLGKTIQAICIACYYRHEWPLLVVVPSSVKFDWGEQLRRWVPSLDPQKIKIVASGKDNFSSASVIIISYDLLARKGDEMKKKPFDVIIMDESHFLKNQKTVRTKAALPLLQGAKRVILLSGTPCLSRPSELYTQIVAVSPRLFKFHDFGVRYCEGKQLPWGWDFTGCSNLGELQLLLEEKLMIRRLKSEVLSQLPSKQRKMVLLDPSSIKISAQLKQAADVNANKFKGLDRREPLLEYFHLTATAKIPAVRDYVLDLLESGQKFLLFAHHQEVLDAMETSVNNKMPGCLIRIDGKTASEQRKVYCDRFQSSDVVRLALLSITAANAGLNLTAASLVVFAELFWNPGILVQAEDRVHRIGQQDSVNVHYLVAPGTADDHIWPLVQSKLDVLSKAGLSREDFSEADTCRIQDSKQEDLRKYFEESFIEDNGSHSNIDEERTEKDSPTKTYMDEKSVKSPTKTPTKQVSIQHFFKQQVPAMSTSNLNTDQSAGCDELDDDCDWLDDIVNWDQIDEEPIKKKQKVS